MIKFIKLVGVCGFVALLFGCGEQKYPVSGKVVFTDGEPVYEGTMVVFTTDDGLLSAFAVVIGSEGRFKDVTFERPGDGLPPGKYQIVVKPPDRTTVPLEVARTAPPNFRIDYKYASVETSGFELNVEGAVKDYTLTLEPTKDTGLRGSAADAAAVQMMEAAARNE